MREAGFYWVRCYQDGWIVAEWRAGLENWACSGEFDISESCWLEIDERRIERQP